jgi:integrase
MNYGVFPRTGSPFWWIYYYTGPKQRVQESSKKRRDDPLGWKQAYDLAKSKARDFGALGRAGNAVWDSWVEEWIESRMPNDNQLKSRKTALQHWRFIRAFLGDRGVDSPVGLSYNLAMEYFAWRKENKRLPSRPKVQTAVTEMALLKRVMHEAVRRGFAHANPIADMELVRPKHKEKPEIMPEEEALIRQELTRREGHLPLTERWMTVSFEIAIRHGWRIAETSFPLSRINFTTWQVSVHQKGDRWRTVPVHPELRPMFTELRRLGAKLSCVFPDNSQQRASYWWSMMLRGCERDNVAGILPHLCFHCCRVTVISRMARAGIPERLIMEWVGHASTAVHRIYQRVRADDLEKCILPSGFSIALPPSDAPRTSGIGQAKPSRRKA